MNDNPEQIIIKQINTLNKRYLDIIQIMLNESTDIEHAMSNIDNNYFIENPETANEFNQLYSNNKLNRIKKEFEYFEKIIDKNNNNCEHEWIDDYIDISCESSMLITYCKKCEVSKKN